MSIPRSAFLRLIRPTLLLGAALLLCVVGQARASSCTSSGDDIPSADIQIGTDNLNQNSSVDLLISANRATALRLFYTVNAQQFSVPLPPEPIHPPTQTFTAQSIRTTTTFIVVAKRNSSATICTLTVPWSLPVDVKYLPAGASCPQQYAVGGWDGQGRVMCARMVPEYDTSSSPEFDPVPSLNMHVCGNGAYFLSPPNFVAAPNFSWGKCITDGWSSTNPVINADVIQFPANCNPFFYPDRIRILIGVSSGGAPVLLGCGYRLRQLPEDLAAQQQTQAAANVFANATGAKSNTTHGSAKDSVQHRQP